MQLEWILHPASSYALLGVSLLACLYLFVAVKREIWIGNLRSRKKQQAMDARIQAIGAGIEELRSGLKDAEERTGLLVLPAPPPTGLNLNTRSQALRLSRRGEGAEQIAATLGIPQNEVELLLKVHRIVLDHS